MVNILSKNLGRISKECQQLNESSFVKLAGRASTHFPFVDVIFGHFLSVIVSPQKPGQGEGGMGLGGQFLSPFSSSNSSLWSHNDREKMTEDEINKREMSARVSSQFYI